MPLLSFFPFYISTVHACGMHRHSSCAPYWNSNFVDNISAKLYSNSIRYRRVYWVGCLFRRPFLIQSNSLQQPLLQPGSTISHSFLLLLFYPFFFHRHFNSSFSTNSLHYIVALHSTIFSFFIVFISTSTNTMMHEYIHIQYSHILYIMWVETVPHTIATEESEENGAINWD